MDGKNALAALDVRTVHHDPAVEAAWSEQGWIEDVRRLVAATRMTPSFDSKPSISTSSWFNVCSRSSWPPPRPAPR